MSASLVGSEMCIRDSNEVISPLGLSTDFKRGTGPPSGVDGRLGTSFDAVSYTHLTLPTICSV
eukprot:13954170-Alexandrium_andersonii.AAC.1